MATNQGVIILAERAADTSIIRAVLSEWGYRESEIQRFLKKPTQDHELEMRGETTADNSGKSY